MKRVFLAIALSVILASGSAALAPAASAASGALAGTWTSVDSDGSNQTLDIKGSGLNVYAMVYFDESATSACGGNPARLSGPGYVDGDDILLVGPVVCLPAGNPYRTRLAITFHYNANTDTLTDTFGIVWHRAS